ncbi:unnamed protein product [Closterium sp. Yama58-4]|nr:unnamed protein product [Closterium sp. Yama58-4]
MGNGAAGARRRLGVSGLLRHADDALTRFHWQIIQVTPTATPGEFSLWVVVGSAGVRRVVVRVPRVFYLNTRAAVKQEEAPGELVSRTLPHGHPLLNLLKLTVQESQFQASRRQLAAHLGDPDVEGVYEAQVPLLTHLLLSLGTVCSVDSRARSKATAATKTTRTTNATSATNGSSSGGAWDMGHLSMRTTTECPYLPSLLSSRSFLYLYHSGADTRAVYALFVPSLPSLLLLFVSPVPTRDVTAAHLHRHFVAAAAAAHAASPDVPPPPAAASVPVKVEYAGSRQEACKAVQRAIEELRGSHRGPLIALVEDATRTASTLPGGEGTRTAAAAAGAGAGAGGGGSGGLGGVAALESMPCVEVPGNAADSRFPALGWQAAAGRVAVHRCAQAPVWLHQRVSLARYAHIPIGNMRKDWILHTADVFFARALRDNNHVSWSPLASPHAQFNAHAQLTQLHAATLSCCCLFSARFARPSTLSSLAPLPFSSFHIPARNALLCFLLSPPHASSTPPPPSPCASPRPFTPTFSPPPHHPNPLRTTPAPSPAYPLPPAHHGQQLLWLSHTGVPDVGGVAEEEAMSFLDEVSREECVERGDRGGHVMEDEAAMCRSAFKVLRGMVTAWVTDVVRTRSLYADALLQHLYRWICSPSSPLHDPFLHRLLHKIMCKLFALLLAELRRLGATVIYADFSRVILATGRRSLPSAMAYVDYLVAAVNSRDAFELLHVEKQRVWHSLLFLDKFNFGGIVDSTQLEQQQQQPEGEGENGHANGNGAAVADANGGGSGDDAGGASADGAGAGKQADGRGGEDGKMTVLSQWNIADYLPSSVQEYFHLTVSDFIFNPWSCISSYVPHSAPSSSSTLPCFLTLSPSSFPYPLSPLPTLCAALQVQNRLTDNLLHLVRALQAEAERGGEDAEGEEEGGEGRRVEKSGRGGQRGKGRGALGATGGRALELVKAVCHVLSLSAHVQHEVQVLRRQLLRVLRVREFAPEAIFRDPCRSFVLPGVICSYCNDCRDLDLCRDQLLQAGEWRCAVQHCQHPYDLLWVENALLEVMRHRVRSYQLQDLVCNKCRQVKSSRAALHCTCAGTFRCSQQAEQLREGLLVLHSVASTHGFPLLLECLQWVLPLCRATGEK